jgi:hypothetical protein
MVKRIGVTRRRDLDDGRISYHHTRQARARPEERGRWMLEADDRVYFDPVRPGGPWQVAVYPRGERELLPGRHRALARAAQDAGRWLLDHPSLTLAALFRHGPGLHDLLAALLDDPLAGEEEIDGVLDELDGGRGVVGLDYLKALGLVPHVHDADHHVSFEQPDDME